MLTTGLKLGPYEIQSSLGAGGMGEVYRARDGRLDRTVAIKVLPASFSSDRDRLQRFAQEARAAAGLNHPNILSIYDIGEDQGAPYIVSELLEGETLRDRLRIGPIPVRKAVEFALQAARGLAAAHEKGIVHRDLKPENIFITNDGHVKILDFGLAKLTRPEGESGAADAATVQAVTEPGLVMGTVGYMSPEQVRGKAADARSDLFAFGAILYEMISGKRAFHGETTADTMSAILKEDPPELSETARNVPPGLERIVHHCLEKNPGQRFQSARDLAFDLEVLTEVSVTPKSGSLPTIVREEIRADSRRKALRIAAAVVFAAVLLGIGWWFGHSKPAGPPAEYQQITFRTGHIGLARFAPDGTIVYDAVWEDGKQQLFLARTDDNGTRPLGITDASLLAVSKNSELAIRLNTINMGGYARMGTLARLPLSGGTPREVLENVGDADWSADGEKMAVTVFVPQTRHWRLEYPIGKVLFDSIKWISTPKISPDGKWVAIADHENPNGDDQGTVAIIGMDGTERKLSSGWTSIEGMIWSRSTDEVWFSASDSGASDNLRGVTLDGKVRTIANVPGGMWTEDVRDGVVLVVSQQQRISISGAPPGSKEEHELGWLGWSTDLSISNDGKKVLFTEEADGGGPNYTAFVRDTDGSPPVRIGDGQGMAISPDNRWVVTQPAKGGPLSMVPVGAGQARQLTHDSITYAAAGFMPDSKHLLAWGIEPGHGGRDYLIDINTGESKPITPEGTAGGPVSPDGRKIIVRGPDGRQGVWSMDSNTLQTIPGLDPQYGITGWLPDSVSVYAAQEVGIQKTRKIYKLNTLTGKMEFWKEFGSGLSGGISGISPPRFSRDGNAYAYIYVRLLSQAYVAKGLK